MRGCAQDRKEAVILGEHLNAAPGSKKSQLEAELAAKRDDLMKHTGTATLGSPKLSGLTKIQTIKA